MDAPAVQLNYRDGSLKPGQHLTYQRKIITIITQLKRSQIKISIIGSSIEETQLVTMTEATRGCCRVEIINRRQVQRRAAPGNTHLAGERKKFLFLLHFTSGIGIFISISVLPVEKTSALLILGNKSTPAQSQRCNAQQVNLQILTERSTSSVVGIRKVERLQDTQFW